MPHPTIVSPLVALLNDKLATETFQKIAHLGNGSMLKKLERSLIQIYHLLNDASEREIYESAVKIWLNDLKHLAYDIDDLLDDLQTEIMHRELTVKSGASTSKVRKLIPACYTMNTKLQELLKEKRGKLEEITMKLQELVEIGNVIGLRVREEIPQQMNSRLQTSFVDESSIVGRESDKHALLRELWDDDMYVQNFSIVTIVGMGGVGKTTLARILYEDIHLNDYFELKAWVCVSNEFDVFNISRTIFQSMVAEDEHEQFTDLNMLQKALKEKISNKLFLFVLDDVWSKSCIDWETLAWPFFAGAPGSKVIMTTRNHTLSTDLVGNRHYHLSVLSHDIALSLFSRHAFDENNFNSHRVIKPYVERVVDKCGGLPLALIALGKLLRSKTDVKDWNDVLNSIIWSLENKDGIPAALRLSYNDLSQGLQQLFAYLSLFPMDYEFHKKELVLLWMAEGFLHQYASTKSMEHFGLQCFEELLSKSFFQHSPNDKSMFVMHDLMHNLATTVAGVFFSRLDIQMKKEFWKEDLERFRSLSFSQEFQKEDRERCRHLSFVCEQYTVDERFKELKGAKSLRTFLVLSSQRKNWKNFYISSKILDDLLHELPLLRVLNLSQVSIKEVPEIIGSLSHLRYLNLSQTRITHIPDNVCNLLNLQTLIVFGCYRLNKFPESFSKLNGLRHLDIGDTPLLKKMPFGIGELKSLQTLSKIIIEGNNGFSMTDLKDLKDLEGKISIMGLDKVQRPKHAQEANFSQKRISELEVEWSDVLDGSRKEALEEEVLNALKPDNYNLKKLRVASYGGLRFPKWVGDPTFLQLAELSIYGCKKCTSLPLLGQLPSLKQLSIGGMDEVKLVGSELLGTHIAFPSLESLSFGNMQGWEEWSIGSGDVNVVFPCLRDLGLHGCPNLVEVSLKALPSLRVLGISGCDQC